MPVFHAISSQRGDEGGRARRRAPPHGSAQHGPRRHPISLRCAVSFSATRRSSSTPIGYGNNCSPVSASSTKIALTGQFSAASRIFSTVSPVGSTASDWRLSLRRNTFGAIVTHMALPTQTSWSTRTRSLRATGRPLLPGDRQRFQRAEGDARLIVQLLGSYLQVGEALRERLEDLLTFHPSQGRPEAVVNPISESHVRVRLSGNVEPVGIGEHLGIAIGGGDEPADAIVLAHHLVAHLDIPRGDPLDRLDRRVIAQALLGRPFGPGGRILFDQRP